MIPNNNTNKKVLYLRWRPQLFQEVIGQEHVITTLKNALLTKSWSHAYLFAGPRGVGKTSTARILAKALNCQSLIDGEPCEKCFNCESVTTGNMMDLIEIDAASHRKIEDIRDLKNSAQYLPNTGKYKVYIIDEAHGLTKFAAEALLKLLEEPPPQVIIILATTEIQSLPFTIVSRCQRFDFRRIPIKNIVEHLTKICEIENIKSTQESLELISKVSTGSLRDAENILEQISVQFNSILTEENVSSSLGLIDDSTSINIALSLLGGDISSVLKHTHSLIDLGVDPQEIQKHILASLRIIALIKLGETNILNESEDLITKAKTISTKFSLQKIVDTTNDFYNQKVISGEYPPISLEMALITVIIKSNNLGKELQKDNNNVENKKASIKQIKEPFGRRPEVESKAPIINENTNSTSSSKKEWTAICEKLKRTKGKKYILGALLKNVENPSPKNSILTLKFKSNSLADNMIEEIKDQKIRKLIETIISEEYNETLTIKITTNGSLKDNKQPPIEESPVVRMAISMGAKIVEKKGD